jgi:calmodulin
MSSSKLVTKTIKKEIKQRVLNIDPEMLNLYKEAFDMFDTEKRGCINPDQIRRALKKFGQDVSRSDVIDMVQYIEHDGKYNITFEQFITLMTTATVEEKVEVLEEEDIIKAFRKFDYDKDGKLTGAEFRYVLTKIAKGLSDREADNILKIANVRNHEYFDFVELVDFWRKFIRKGN